jgi:hypothetical protein
VLQLDGCVDGIERILESRMRPVAQHLDDLPSMSGHGRAHDCVVTSKSSTHQLGALLPELGASLDVGEEKGDDARRCLHAGGSAANRWLA